MEQLRKGVWFFFVMVALLVFCEHLTAGTYSGGTGTAQEPYLIADANDLLELADCNEDYDKHFLLINDINLAAYEFSRAVIGADKGYYFNRFSGLCFTGTFNGNNYIIRNLNIDSADVNSDYLGLFGFIEGTEAKIENLGLENFKITGGDESDYLGCLCGISSGTIVNCYSSGTVSSGNARMGKLGGLCGGSRGVISSCYAAVSIAGFDYLGGLCGSNDGTIVNSYSTSSVTGKENSNYVGGLCGFNHRGLIRNSYASGLVTGDDYIGGLCGFNDDGNISNCYFYLFNGPDNNSGIVLDDLQMQDASSFVGFDFLGDSNDGSEDFWEITDGHMPKLAWQTDPGPLFVLNSPITTLAGSGYSDDPFQLNSYADFTEFRTNSRLSCGYYVLTTDIDLGGETFSESVINRYFGGHFDGGGYSICDVTIEIVEENANNVGLFRTATASVSNLSIKNVNLTGGYNSGYIGSMCGSNLGEIYNCYATGFIHCGEFSGHLGGLCGSNEDTIKNCYTAVSITGEKYTSVLGGLCGSNCGGIIKNCYSVGSVAGHHHLGGLCGHNEKGTITNSYATGVVTGGYDVFNSTGGFCGSNYRGTINNCYHYLLNGFDNNLGVDLDDRQIQDAASFAGFDFVDDSNDGSEGDWVIGDGYLPKLVWQTDDGPQRPVSSIVTTLCGSGNSYDPFQISSYADFTEFRTNNSLRCGYYILATDINLAGETLTTSVIDSGFGGHFNGNGHVIRNITIDTKGEGTDYLGFFSIIVTSVSDLGVENINIIGGDNSRYLGGLCGYNYGIISGCYATSLIGGMGETWFLGGLCGCNDYGAIITNCCATGSIVGFGNVGGLCGENDGGTITNCYTDISVYAGDYARSIGGLCGFNSNVITNCYTAGSVTTGKDSKYIGGLCGFNNCAEISNCYTTVSVTGGNDSLYLGGLCGDNRFSPIVKCFAGGSIDGAQYLGGLCGRNYGGLLSNCYAVAPVAGDKYLGGLCGINREGIISNCYAIGSVTGNDFISGFCGFIDRSTITNCFWDVESSGVGLAGDDNFGAVGKTTAQMQTMETFTNAGWDFDWYDGDGADWFIQVGEYPILTWQISPADIYTDGLNNWKDFAVFAEFWQRDDCSVYNNYCDWADLDFSGDVGIDDLVELADYWLATGVWD